MFDIKARSHFNLQEKLLYNIWQELKIMNTPKEEIKEVKIDKTRKVEPNNDGTKHGAVSKGKSRNSK